jgi:hypothetical protein
VDIKRLYTYIAKQGYKHKKYFNRK